MDGLDVGEAEAAGELAPAVGVLPVGMLLADDVLVAVGADAEGADAEGAVEESASSGAACMVIGVPVVPPSTGDTVTVYDLPGVSPSSVIVPLRGARSVVSGEEDPAAVPSRVMRTAVTSSDPAWRRQATRSEAAAGAIAAAR